MANASTTLAMPMVMPRVVRTLRSRLRVSPRAASRTNTLHSMASPVTASVGLGHGVVVGRRRAAFELPLPGRLLASLEHDFFLVGVAFVDDPQHVLAGVQLEHAGLRFLAVDEQLRGGGLELDGEGGRRSVERQREREGEHAADATLP